MMFGLTRMLQVVFLFLFCLMINLVVFVIIVVISFIVLVFVVWLHPMKRVVSVCFVLVRFLFLTLGHSVWVLVVCGCFVVELTRGR